MKRSDAPKTWDISKLYTISIISKKHYEEVANLSNLIDEAIENFKYHHADEISRDIYLSHGIALPVILINTIEKLKVDRGFIDNPATHADFISYAGFSIAECLPNFTESDFRSIALALRHRNYSEYGLLNRIIGNTSLLNVILLVIVAFIATSNFASSVVVALFGITIYVIRLFYVGMDRGENLQAAIADAASIYAKELKNSRPSLSRKND